MGNRTKDNLEPCGSVAAIRRHYRHHEELCPACKQAERRKNKDRYAKEGR